MEFETVIGMEVHVELHTAAKLFCRCPNAFSPEANTNICEVCLGFPGTMPLLNSEAVEQSLKASLALNCEIALHSWFDRKNYFYPDIPKGYQISQYFTPIGSKGYIEIMGEDGNARRISINRVHIEEDAGKLVHARFGNYSMVDFNRAGVPLIEIVTDPDLRSPAEARQYLEKLKSVLQYTGVSDCKMEEGSLRCDANVSLRPRGSRELGEKTELKNMNSFKAVEKSLEYEVKRQARLLRDGHQVIPETRRWDEENGKTILMRSKLQATDYRCFADPELAPIALTTAHVEAVRSRIPELAPQRLERYVNDYGLPPYDAEVLTAAPRLSDYFEACLKEYANPKTLSNWIMGEFSALLKEEGVEPDQAGLTPANLVQLLGLIDDGAISGKMAKDVLEKSFRTGRSPREIVEEEGLLQISDQSELEKIVAQVIGENPQSVQSYHSGKKKAIGFMVGQIMKATRGKANPQVVNQILARKLAENTTGDD